MRILIIEDEPKMSSYLRKGLTEASFTVDTAADGKDGLFLALHEEFDLIVLDVMLPELSGLEVLKRLRMEKNTPVLFPPAGDPVNEKGAGFELGADDCLSKPFAYVEFLARIRSLIRRAPRATRDVLTVGDLEVDLVKRRSRRANARIDLTAQKCALLHPSPERQA